MEPFFRLVRRSDSTELAEVLGEVGFFLAAGAARLANEPRLRYPPLPELSGAARDPSVGSVG